jgi:hypothetical protein
LNSTPISSLLWNDASGRAFFLTLGGGAGKSNTFFWAHAKDASDVSDALVELETHLRDPPTLGSLLGADDDRLSALALAAPSLLKATGMDGDERAAELAVRAQGIALRGMERELLERARARVEAARRKEEEEKAEANAADPPPPRIPSRTPPLRTSPAATTTRRRTSRREEDDDVEASARGEEPAAAPRDEAPKNQKIPNAIEPPPPPGAAVTTGDLAALFAATDARAEEDKKKRAETRGEREWWE